MVGAADNVDMSGPPDAKPYEKNLDERRVISAYCCAYEATTTMLLEVATRSRGNTTRSTRVTWLSTGGYRERRRDAAGTETEQPTVLDVKVTGDRMLASVEKGGVPVVVEASAGTSESELEATFADVSERIERTAELFTGGDR